MSSSSGEGLRKIIAQGRVCPFIGIYDLFSASIAARYFDGIFISGFGFSASFYGLPDRGFTAWADIAAFTHRVRGLLPDHHILVDIDDGYGDSEVAAHVASVLERSGASGIVIEDQRRPRRCGHLEGKKLLGKEEFVEKLKVVLSARSEIFVVARTDAVDIEEIIDRTSAYARAGADAILVDAVRDTRILKTLKERVSKPIVFNYIAGGKSPAVGLKELQAHGVSIALYSTPCLFAAQAAVEDAVRRMKENDGLVDNGRVDLKGCTSLLDENLSKKSRQRHET